jgi:hypothetical protein
MPRAARSIALDLVSATPATIYNNGNLTTNAVKYPDSATPGIVKNRKFFITNKHASAGVAIAWSTVTTSPTFAAAANGSVATTEGLPVMPLSQLEINLPSTLSLWVVASAGSTPVSIMAIESDG